jgi:hypothetical protein
LMDCGMHWFDIKGDSERVLSSQTSKFARARNTIKFLKNA